MARTITVLHTPGCPNVALVRQRVADALARLTGADPDALARLTGADPEVVVEEIADPDEAARRDFHGSPTLFVDGIDPFADSGSPAAFACRTYRTEAGIEGAPSVDQIAAVLAASHPNNGHAA